MTLDTVILACSSLLDYVQAAQQAQKTNYPIILVDKKHHTEPDKMKNQIIEVIDSLPAEVTTVLVAMGFCGGAWSETAVNRRVVIPRVDDCVSLLLHRDAVFHPNLKEPGHLYMIEKNSGDFSVEKMFQANSREYPNLSQEALFQMFFSGYRHLDIVDTGLTDCYSEAYVAQAQENADQLNATLDYVQGSLFLLEKLLSGQWDAQFIVADAGTTIRHGDFF